MKKLQARHILTTDCVHVLLTGLTTFSPQADPQR